MSDHNADDRQQIEQAEKEKIQYFKNAGLSPNSFSGESAEALEAATDSPELDGDTVELLEGVVDDFETRHDEAAEELRCLGSIDEQMNVAIRLQRELSELEADDPDRITLKGQPW